jgi:uncharacterized membrane-anchored protein
MPSDVSHHENTRIGPYEFNFEISYKGDVLVFVTKGVKEFKLFPAATPVEIWALGKGLGWLAQKVNAKAEADRLVQVKSINKSLILGMLDEERDRRIQLIEADFDDEGLDEESDSHLRNINDLIAALRQGVKIQINHDE